MIKSTNLLLLYSLLLFSCDFANSSDDSAGIDILSANQESEMREQIRKCIAQVNSEGGKANYSIFDLNNGYFLQFAGSKNSNFLRCEASITNSEAQEVTLNNEEIGIMLTLGWMKPEPGEFNYYSWANIETEVEIEAVVDRFIKTIQEVYKAMTIVKTDVHLD